MARSTAVYDDFGTSPPFFVLSPAVYGGPGWIADAFTPLDDAVLASITVATGHILFNDAITINLMADNAGHPGTIIESWTIANPPAFSNHSTITVTDSIAAPLTAGTQYWVALRGSRVLDNDWGLSSTGSTGLVEIGDPTLGWTTDTIPLPNEAFEVDGTPEPGTLWLLAIGGAALVYRKFRVRSS